MDRRCNRNEITAFADRRHRKKDICADADGNLVFGLGENYVAQVEIPPKEYEYIEGEADAEGKKTVERVQKDFDISKCTLILWSIEEVYINE